MATEPPKRDANNHPRRLLEAAKAAGRPLYVQAPMVSKLPFRALVRDYGVDLCYTPMILAKEFVRSENARRSDFTTNAGDAPLVVQFGAHDVTDFARAAEMVAPYCDGVNLNCGCPQSWAIQEGVGCALMKKPELVREMVLAAKKRCGDGFCVSIKIRIHPDLEETAEFVRIVETSGVDYITVHGRTRNTRSSLPVNLDGIKRVKEVATVPVVANGDVFTLEDATRIARVTGVDGVMAARGLMTNPALFAGFQKTPWGAVERFMDYVMEFTIPSRLTQHHICEMLDGLVLKKERSQMYETVTTIVELVDWLDERFILRRKGDPSFGESIDIEKRIKP
ncbi:Dus4 protein [Trichophaea hybrida]|nr:Dus4 protein [Trichophaea hybrida]